MKRRIFRILNYFPCIYLRRKKNWTDWLIICVLFMSRSRIFHSLENVSACKCVQFLRLSFLCWEMFCDKPVINMLPCFCEFNERTNQFNHLLREATDTKTQCNPDPCWKINKLYMYLWKRL